ncbi:aromatic ring-hydroxylating dioxygenase subunit alpha [Mangrovicoccus sp. HB161399]|uniref:aromatic ring-hydroxylating oxygenase subunit alpha n=1 Tax=Mangrovicoccus sp. HB161399 TaxID=2720392 RepID=UPI001553AC20|nr:aromatic ring-hydroxylating dioxygenase subunit alpha [Mangrovicoccus sp. HB161399]
MLNESEVLARLLRRRPGHSLAQEFYCDPGVFRTDMEQIWYRDWLFVLPACEIPKYGDYVVHEIGNYSVVIVRGTDNEIRAFHNSCRHRGSVLCKSRKGRNPKIVCPCHQWTYELDGKLLWARDMGPDFNPAEHGLKQVHCRNASGMVYICVADEAPDFAEFAAGTARYLAMHDLENSKVAFESTIIEKGNWKLVWENNRECYHCAGNHPSLCRTFPEDPRTIGNDADGSMASLQADHLTRCESVGALSAYHISAIGDWRFVRTPLLGTSESYTMDGKVAVTRPNSSIPFKDAGALLKFRYPGTWNHFLSDPVILFRVTPISATETEVCTKWLVHKDAVEGVDYDLKRLTEVWVATNDEDREVVENNQRGIQSPAYQPGPYSETHEGGLIQFSDWYAGALVRGITGAGPSAPATLAAE